MFEPARDSIISMYREAIKLQEVPISPEAEFLFDWEKEDGEDAKPEKKSLFPIEELIRRRIFRRLWQIAQLDIKNREDICDRS